MAYLLPRDSAETTRLNDQHRLFTCLMGNQYIHPSIPIGEINSVADIGTGTGIWLVELAQYLPSRAPWRRLYGFDISSSQFPAESHILASGVNDVSLSVHDALTRYPVEHRGRYDLVHIRLLTAGLKEDEYKTVLTNAKELLRPNGYIQWEEIDDSTFCTDAAPENRTISRIRDIVRTAMFKLGYSHRAPRCVYEALVSSDFKNIRRQTYTIKGYEYLREVATDWVVGVIRVLVTPSLVVAGEAANEAEAMAITERVVREYIAHCKTALPMVNLDMFVAQI